MYLRDARDADLNRIADKSLHKRAILFITISCKERLNPASILWTKHPLLQNAGISSHLQIIPIDTCGIKSYLSKSYLSRIFYVCVYV